MNCGISPKVYNEECWPVYHKARSFVQCLEHAIEKGGGDAARQLSIIGWSREVEKHLIAALECYDREMRNNIRWELARSEIRGVD